MLAPDPHDKQQRSDEMTALINNYKADTLTPWTHKHAIRHGLIETAEDPVKNPSST